MSIKQISPASSVAPKLFAFSGDLSPAIALGSGFNTRTRTVMNLVASGTSKQDARAAAKAEYVIDWCENYSELAKFFGLSASASYSGGGVGGSASVNMVSKTNIQTSRIYIAVSVRMIASLQFLPSAELQQEALRVLMTDKLSSFVEKFGSTFAKTLFLGGELACILEISASQTETIEQLRVAMEGHGWGAKAEGEMEQSLRELTQRRSVNVKYCQSGGAVGNATSEIVETDVIGVIERMGKFILEVWGTNGLDGKTVPLQAEFANVRTLTNWPKNETGDPEQPYPDEIERIATSALLLKDRLVVVEDVLRPGRQVSPSTIEIAKSLLAYLTYVVADSSVMLGKMIRGATENLKYENESFYQYRIRRLLNVDPGPHENCGDLCDYSNNDSAQFLERVFGSAKPILIGSWPELILQDWWGYQGQDDRHTAYGGIFIKCHDDGGDIMAAAYINAGYPKTEDHVLLHASLAPSPYSRGGKCGSTPVHMVAVRTKQPDATQLDPMPLLPDAIILKSEINVKKGKLDQIDKGVYQANFTCDLPSVSCGRYVITITESKVGNRKIVRRRILKSYWLRPDKENIKLKHTFLSDAAWEVNDFEVEVERALRMA
jgi:hypothetical protein